MQSHPDNSTTKKEDSIPVAYTGCKIVNAKQCGALTKS
jgi:hypothetical protein